MERRRIENEEQALALVQRLAKEHEAEYHRDMDALLELGDADIEIVLDGYLWEVVEDEVPEMEEEEEDLLIDAIVDFYIDMLEC